MMHFASPNQPSKRPVLAPPQRNISLVDTTDTTLAQKKIMFEGTAARPLPNLGSFRTPPAPRKNTSNLALPQRNVQTPPVPRRVPVVPPRPQTPPVTRRIPPPIPQQQPQFQQQQNQHQQQPQQNQQQQWNTMDQRPAGVEAPNEVVTTSSPKMSRLRSPKMLRRFLSPPPQRVQMSESPQPSRKASKPEFFSPQVTRKGTNDIHLGFTSSDKFKPDQRQKVEGSHKSIGLPTTFIHCNDIKGELELLYGRGQWVKHWFEITKGSLTWRLAATNHELEGKINLQGGLVEPHSTNSHPYVLVISPQNTDPLTVAATCKEDVLHWVKCLKGNGCTYKETVAFKVEEKKVRENPIAKAEEEYIKNKDKMFAERAAARQFTLPDPANCEMSLKVVKGSVTDGKLKFQIEVVYDQQKWTIHRLDNQMKELKAQLKSRLSLQLEKVPKKAHPDLVVQIYGRRLNVIMQNRREVFRDTKAATSFVRFVAPLQYGDEKPAGFIMPFENRLILASKQMFRRF